MESKYRRAEMGKSCPKARWAESVIWLVGGPIIWARVEYQDEIKDISQIFNNFNQPCIWAWIMGESGKKCGMVATRLLLVNAS